MKKDSIVTILLVFNILMVSCTTLIKRQGATYDFTPLDSIISSWMDKGYYPGGAICVVKNDSVLFEKVSFCVNSSLILPVYVLTCLLPGWTIITIWIRLSQKYCLWILFSHREPGLNMEDWPCR